MQCTVFAFWSIWFMVFDQNIARKKIGVCCTIMRHLIDQQIDYHSPYSPDLSPHNFYLLRKMHLLFRRRKCLPCTAILKGISIDDAIRPCKSLYRVRRRPFLKNKLVFQKRIIFWNYFEKVLFTLARTSYYMVWASSIHSTKNSTIWWQVGEQRQNTFNTSMLLKDT